MKKFILTAVFGLGIAAFAFGGSNQLQKNPDLPEKGSLALTDASQPKDTVTTVYTCPMHPEVIRDKPGKCPKCGMNLVAKEMKNVVYTCPMHPEVVSNKPGKCPKCGMNLEMKAPAKKSATPKK